MFAYICVCIYICNVLCPVCESMSMRQTFGCRETGKVALNYDTEKKRYNHNHYTSKNATSYNKHKIHFAVVCSSKSQLSMAESNMSESNFIRKLAKLQ